MRKPRDFQDLDCFRGHL